MPGLVRTGSEVAERRAGRQKKHWRDDEAADLAVQRIDRARGPR